MPKLKHKQLKKREPLRKLARELWIKGYSLRDIGEELGMSHEWVRDQIKDGTVELSTGGKN